MEKFLRSDGRLGIILKLSIPPHGQATLQSYDDFDDIKKTEAMMLEVQSNWATLWPNMLQLLEEAIVDWEVEVDLEEEEFEMGISNIRPGYFMSDQADYLISFELGDEGPSWDYFIKGDNIIHFQPCH